jgi:hypothetical protein
LRDERIEREERGGGDLSQDKTTRLSPLGRGDPVTGDARRSAEDEALSLRASGGSEIRSRVRRHWLPLTPRTSVAA